MPYFAHVVDNHYMRVTTQLRRSTALVMVPQEMLLSHALGWDMATLLHVPPLEVPSARFEEVSLDQFRQQGYLPETLLNFLTSLIWTHPEGKAVYAYEDFQHGFKNLPGEALSVDNQRLDQIQREYWLSKS
jgi:glutamyl-tRNA synthetase